MLPPRCRRLYASVSRWSRALPCEDDEREFQRAPRRDFSAATSCWAYLTSSGVHSLFQRDGNKALMISFLAQPLIAISRAVSQTIAASEMMPSMPRICRRPMDAATAGGARQQATRELYRACRHHTIADTFAAPTRRWGSPSRASRQSHYWRERRKRHLRKCRRVRQYRQRASPPAVSFLFSPRLPAIPAHAAMA